jgi:hypothetical protein
MIGNDEARNVLQGRQFHLVFQDLPARSSQTATFWTSQKAAAESTFIIVK